MVENSKKVSEKPMQTDENGVITIKDLAVGKYFLVEEKPTEEVMKNFKDIENKINVGKYMAFSNDNRLTFEYTENGELKYPNGSKLMSKIKPVKVINYDRPDIKKVVDKKIGSTEKDFFNYTITTKIPGNIKEYTKFDIVDTPNRDLELVFESFKITSNHKAESIEPEDALDQAAQTAQVVAEKSGKEADKKIADQEKIDGKVTAIRATFDPKKLKGGETITITVTGKLKGTVEAWKDKENDAKVVYNNGYVEEEKHSQVQVKTLAHKVLKIGRGLFGTEVAQEKLAGVQFKFYKKDGDNIKWIKYADDKSLTFVDSEAEAQTFTTDEKGEIILNGLNAGEYFAKEIKTVKGYQLPVDGQEITDFQVTENDNTETVTEIKNIKNPDLPHTGLYWSDLIAAGLALLVIAGSAAYVISRKKRITSAN